MYQSRKDFFTDVTQMVQNSTKFNGSESVFTKKTEAMKEVTLEALNENAVEFEQLEGCILLASQHMAEQEGDSSLHDSSNSTTPGLSGLGMAEYIASVIMKVIHFVYKATTMRLLVSHQLPIKECMRAGGLSHYLIIIIN